MKPHAEQASVRWTGTRQQGKGRISTLVPKQRTLFAASTDLGRRGTNPCQLIAAAHAGSFSRTLAHELAEAGYRPRQIDTTATVTVENLAGGSTMTQIHLDVIASVPKAAECDFVDAALRARANCPVSRALKTNISMHAQLNPNKSA